MKTNPTWGELQDYAAHDPAGRDLQPHSDDRWSERDWRQAAQRAFTAIGEQWTSNPTRSRLLLIACLRQGLAPARDFGLPLGWLTEATWA